MSTAEKMPLAPKAKDMSLAKKVVRFGSAIATATSVAGVGTAHAGTIENTASTPGMPATIVEQKSTTEKYQEALTQAGLSTAQSEQPATPGESESKDLGIITPEGSGGTEETPPTQETPEIVATPGESETFQESYEYQSTDTFELKPTGANSEDETQNWTLTVTRDGKSYDFKLYESANDLRDKVKLGFDFEGAWEREGQIHRRLNLIYVGVETQNLTVGDAGQFSEPFHLLIGLMYNEKDGSTLQVVFPRYDNSKVMNPNTGSAQPVPEVFEYLDRLPPGRIVSIDTAENRSFIDPSKIRDALLKDNNMDEATCLKDEKCARQLFVWTEYSGTISGVVQWLETGSTDGLMIDEYGRAVVSIFGAIYK